jgi:hypothetical protein
MKEVVLDCWGFLRTRKKYWLAPIILTLLALAALAFFSQTATVGFIYTVF